MTWIDYATWGGLALIPLFMILDLVYRARRFDTPRFWRLRALAVTLFSIALSFVIPSLWARVLGSWKLLDLSFLGIAAGAVVGILVYELGHYWYHRTVHRSDTLFRIFHQMHHSPESLDIWGAYYLSPADVVGFVSLQTLIFGPLLGLPMEAVVIGSLFLTFNGVFQHVNIRTPAWLGYIIQRPESHGIHHQRGVHAWNYSDLPLWDMVFGTFRNPHSFEGEVGYWKGASSRIGSMLLAKDVSVAETP
ncbi:MAG TPA: sterol desaturase family protein [Thermoanaerobaculia bacterium]|nr:sterol desaturase family protein [Thermoanaerobaculia bacterium]